VVWEKRLLGAAERSSWYAITVAANEEELLAKQKRFEALSSVSQVRSILDIKPEAGEQERRIALVRGVRDAFEGMELGELPSPPRPDVPKLKTMLDKVKLTLRNKSAEEAGKLAAEIDVARNELLALIDALGSTAEKDAADRLAAFQSPFFEDFRDKFDLLRKNLNPTPITLADIPESILRRFVSPQGRYLMHLYSAKDIWQREAMAEFANQLRAADPAATGAPIIGSESIRLMAQGYLQGGLYAFSAIVIVVLLTFRGVRDTILCLSPVLVAAVWTLGLMGVAGIQFNLANLIVVPLVLGVSVDGAILMLDRAREEGCATALLLSSASRAVLLSMLTTMVGFGALMVADHYGIFSLGLLLTLAVGSALVATLTALPAVLFYVFPGRQVARQDEGQVATPST
jgi:predicted RND superfamily exporter protein